MGKTIFDEVNDKIKRANEQFKKGGRPERGKQHLSRIAKKVASKKVKL